MIAVTGAKTDKLIFIPKDNVACINEVLREQIDDVGAYPAKFTRISLKKSTTVEKVYCLETPEEVATQMSLN